MHDAVQGLFGARHDPSLAVLEGFHAIKHALRFGAPVSPIVTDDRDALLDLARRLAPDVHDHLAAVAVEVGPEDWRALGAGSLPTPAVGAAPRPGPGERVGDGPLVLLEDPRHLGNLGACVRVAAAAGGSGVVTTGAADPWHPSAIRAAAGLHFAVRVERLASSDDLASPIVAVDPAGSPLGEVALPADVAYAFGTERDGLSGELLERAVAKVAIPMRTGVSSLNLAIAVAVVLYHHRGVVA